MYRNEVTDVILSEYDEQQHIENEKRWSYEDGLTEGLTEGRTEGINLAHRLTELLIETGRQEDVLRAFQDKQFCRELMMQYGLIEEEK